MSTCIGPKGEYTEYTEHDGADPCGNCGEAPTWTDGPYLVAANFERPKPPYGTPERAEFDRMAREGS